MIKNCFCFNFHISAEKFQDHNTQEQVRMGKKNINQQTISCQMPTKIGRIFSDQRSLKIKVFKKVDLLLLQRKKIRKISLIFEDNPAFIFFIFYCGALSIMKAHKLLKLVNKENRQPFQ